MNPTMIQFFHWYSDGNARLWQKVQKQAPHLSELGITSVWLPPAYKGAAGGYSVGYDPYDLYDLGEFDQKNGTPTKYGTFEEYKKATQALKAENIEVIVDIVLNHKAGGDEKEKFLAAKINEEDRTQFLSDYFEIESYTKFTFPGRGEKYSNFQWDFKCFSGVDFAENQGTHIYKIKSEYGEDWEQMIDDEKGNYDYLMYNDIEHRNPFVREELNKWAMWYFSQIDFDGVRLDAVKHISFDFYKEWLALLRSNAGKNIFAVGEYWAPGQLTLLQKYLGATEHAMSLFDSSLQHNFHKASVEGNSYDLRTIFDDTLTKENPLFSVSLVDNHDTQPLQDLEAPVEKWFKPIAYSLILLRENGYPCIFYPDLFGAHYTDKDKDGNDQEIFLDKVEGIEEILKVRKNNAFGLQRDYFEDANCIGFTREGDEEHFGCAVLISNKDAYNKPMEVGEKYTGKSFFDVLKKFDEKVLIDENGWGNFLTKEGSVSIWIPEN